MRQKAATWVIVGVSVVLVGFLLVFGCERSAEHDEGTVDGADHDELMEGGHHEDTPEAGRHGGVGAAAGEHHGAMPGAGHTDPAQPAQEADAARQQAGLELSGRVADGVRVVKLEEVWNARVPGGMCRQDGR